MCIYGQTAVYCHNQKIEMNRIKRRPIFTVLFIHTINCFKFRKFIIFFLVRFVTLVYISARSYHGIRTISNCFQLLTF